MNFYPVLILAAVADQTHEGSGTAAPGFLCLSQPLPDSPATGGTLTDYVVPVKEKSTSIWGGPRG
jgi:hypothetical protein